MILSPNRSGRGGKTVRLIVVHTAEGARTVESLGSYFSRSSVGASSHAGIDDKRIETYVPYEQMAWTVRSGNAISDNVELCGFAKWTREQWLGEHRPMLELTAKWIAERCKARNVPIRKLTPAQVAAGQAGVCGHIDWTLGMRDGSHTDPGPGFPWDVVIALASGQENDVHLPMLQLGDGIPDKKDTGPADPGRKHWFVTSAQALINLRGLPAKVTVDGQFGPSTEAMVKALQKRSGLPQTGKVDAATWYWLLGNDAPDFA